MTLSKNTLNIFLAFGLLMIIIENVSGQFKLDSLIEQLNFKRKDTVKVNFLNFISSEYSSLNPDTAYFFATEAFNLSKKINYLKGQGYALLRLSTIEINSGEHTNASDKLQKAIEIANQIEDNDLIGSIYLKTALIDRKEGNYRVAIEKIMKAVDLFTLTSNNSGLSKAYINLGNISYLRGNYPASLNYYFEAIKLLEQLNDLHTKASCLINIGAVYGELQNMEKYLEFTNSALKIFERIGDNKSMAICYNNIGLWNIRNGDFQNAMSYFLAALEKYKTVDSKDKMVECISNIGYTNYQLKQYAKAFDFYDYADSLAMVSRNMDVIARNKLNRALIFFEGRDLIKAKTLIFQGIHEAVILGNKSTLANAYQLIARIDSATGNFENAYAHYKIYKIYQDSVMFLEKETQQKLIESRYEDEMNILTLRYQNEQKSLELSENRKRTRISYYLIGAFILIIVFAALAVINRFRFRQNKLITQEKIRNQKEQFKVIINAQENERSRIARDLHDGIGQSMSGMILQFEQLLEKTSHNGNESKEKSQKIFTMMNEIYTELRNLSHQIMPRALKQVGLNAAISDLLSKTFAGTSVNYHFETFGEMKLSEEMAVGIYRITQELVTNIIKHAKASEVSVHFLTNNGNLLLLVEDDGVGINENDNTKQLAGIGLNNITGRVGLLNGSFTIEPGPEKGTIATIKIPLANQMALDSKIKENENRN